MTGPIMRAETYEVVTSQDRPGVIQQAGLCRRRDPMPERFQSKLCSLKTALTGDVFPTIRLVLAKFLVVTSPGDEPWAINLPRTERRTPRRTGNHESAKPPVFLAPLPQPLRTVDPDQWRKRLAWHASRPLGFLWHWRRSSLLVLPDGLMERGCDAHERWSPFIYACLHS